MADNVFSPSISIQDTPSTSDVGSDEDPAEDLSVALCEEGDSFLLGAATSHYGAAHQFSRAIDKYKDAIILDPHAALPHVRLSIVHFELGNYAKCITESRQALDLLQENEANNEAMVQEARVRLLKALLHTHQIAAAEETVNEMGLQEEELEGGDVNIKQIQTVWSCAEPPADLEKRIIETLPYYKPSLEANDYYVCGQDQARTLYDQRLSSELAKNAEVSFFFAGIQDCRNVYTTWIHAFYQERERPSKRKFHFVINDLKRTTIARNLVLWFLIDQVDYNSPSSQQTKALNTLVLAYSSPIIPAYVYQELRDAIENVIEAIEQNSLPAWFSVRDCDRLGLIEALNGWLDRESFPNETEQIINSVIEIQRYYWEEHNTHAHTRKKRFVPTKCEQELELFRKCGAIYPAKSVSEECEPRLADLLYRHKNKGAGGSNQNLREYFKREWKPNLFSVDVDCWDTAAPFNENTFPPFLLPHQLYSQSGLKKPDHPESFYDYIARFFLEVAGAVGHLRDRMNVKTACGDATLVLDTIRRCWAPPGSTSDKWVNERTYFLPKYDRIHLLNLPDYHGGTLFYALYAIPVLKTHNAAYVTGVCSRNPSIWKSIQNFHNEYLKVNDDETLRKVSQMALFVSSSDAPSGRRSNLAVMKGYLAFRRTISKAFPFHDLLPQKNFLHWLYSLFITIALPVRREHNNDPKTFLWLRHNLTVFFRLLIHLRLLGYPSHWLSAVLTKILKNQVRTSARAAKCYPSDIAATQKEHPMKPFNTAPFQLELSSLTPIFQPILPFAVLDANLPPLNSIYNYSIRFRSVGFGLGLEKTTKEPLVLQFANETIFKEVRKRTLYGKMSMRDLLIGSEEGDSQVLSELREKGVYLITTFKWNRVSQTASFWLRKDVVDETLCNPEGPPWSAILWRTDEWMPVSSTSWLREDLKIGEPWVSGWEAERKEVDGGEDDGKEADGEEADIEKPDGDKTVLGLR